MSAPCPLGWRLAWPPSQFPPWLMHSFRWTRIFCRSSLTNLPTSKNTAGEWGFVFYLQKRWPRKERQFGHLTQSVQAVCCLLLGKFQFPALFALCLIVVSTVPQRYALPRLSSQSYWGLSLSGKYLVLLQHLLISSDTSEAKHGTFLGPGGEKDLIWLRTEGQRGLDLADCAKPPWILED